MTAALEAQALAPVPRYAAPGVPAQTLAAWRAGPGAFLVLGFAASPVPASGTVRGQSGTEPPGVFRCLSWPGRRAGDAGRHAFLAAVRLLDGATTSGGASVLLRGETGETLAIQMPDSLAGDESFGQQAGRISGAHAVPVVRFMLNMLRPREERHDPRIGALLARMLRAFLTEAAAKDGCIEIMAAVPDACAVLQGWGAPLRGNVEVLLAGATLPWFSGHAGEFERKDIAAPATGVMLALPAKSAAVLAGTDHVFVISDRGLHSRALVDRRLLDPIESAGHIRHMSPLLRCQPPMRAMLDEALRPRYEGRDTLAASKRPVRAAVDFAAAAPDAGVFLAGWVFDPAGQIARVDLRGNGDLAARIDETWVRVARPDVIASFREAPGFPPSRTGDPGFTVAVAAAPAEGEDLYLCFTFSDGDRAFLPVTAARLEDPTVRARLLKDVDLFKPSGRPILERHAAPLMARLRPATGQTARILVQGPTERPRAIVVPLAAGNLPRTFVSGFLRDPPEETELIVFVCGPEWDRPHLDALQALARFHDLPAAILTLEETARPLPAMREAARIGSAEAFLLASPGLAAPLGWRRALRAAAGASAFTCPTILYEDWSIRYAGTGELTFQETAPFARTGMALAGMPVTLVTGTEPRIATAGSLACCLIPRAALAPPDDPGTLVTGIGAEADFFARLRASGQTGLWVPSVTVYAPEEPGDPPPHAAGQIVDGWILRSEWRPERRA